MTVLGVIGDVHCAFDHLTLVLERIVREGADGILLVGDLGANRFGLFAGSPPDVEVLYRRSAMDVLERVRATGLPFLWVPGNHDPRDLEGEGNVDGRVARIGDLRVAGIGGAGPDRFGFAYEWSEDEIRARVIPDCDVLLCHAPPRDTPLDLAARDLHVGSAAVRERAERHRGVLVCGHIHESPGFARLGDCLCLNVGGLGVPHGRPQVGFLRGPDRVEHLDLPTGRRRSSMI